MMRLRRASVIVLLSLLTSAATAHGESPWTVWRITKGTWKPISVWATQKECEVELPRYAVPTDGTLLVDAFVYGWICLPDTVDPRGPKGK